MKDPHLINVPLLFQVCEYCRGSFARTFDRTSTAQDDVLKKKNVSFGSSDVYASGWRPKREGTHNSYDLSSKEISKVKSFQSGLIELTNASFHSRVFPLMYFSLAIASTIDSKPS